MGGGQHARRTQVGRRAVHVHNQYGVAGRIVLQKLFKGIDIHIFIGQPKNRQVIPRRMQGRQLGNFLAARRHQVAQKLTTTHWPRKSDSCTYSPSSAGSSKSTCASAPEHARTSSKTIVLTMIMQSCIEAAP